MRLASPLAALLAALTIPACTSSDAADAGDAEDDVDAVVSGKADSPTEGSADAVKLLALVNDPSVFSAELDEKAGLSTRLAEAIVEYREGADKYASPDDNLFDTIAELDAIPRLGPVALDALLKYARKTASTTTISVDLVANEWTSGGGDRAVKLSSLNAEIAAQGFEPFPDKLTLGGRDDRQFLALMWRIEQINEKMNRNLELQRSWDPSEYTNLCYAGSLTKVSSTVESLSGSLFHEYMGIQAWRWKDTSKIFVLDWFDEQTEAEWLRVAREDNGNEDDADTWEGFDTSSDDFLMMTDGGQQGDGTELFSVRIKPCE